MIFFLQCVIDTQHTIWFEDQNMTLQGSDSQVPATQDVHVAGEHVCECVCERMREREKNAFLFYVNHCLIFLSNSPIVCLEEWTESAKL